ncbi:IS110 family transposase [Candidatus Electronema sp. PJ]|uniref:IS110 family transposase n=1 Tax=Candidatus Electronema sp. PJ TaxID=3401572 RepID=UPI003AA9384C
MNHQYILGIDVAKAKLDIALMLPNGKFRSKVVPNTPEGFAVLAAWLGQHGAGTVHACMEATGFYWESAVEFLTEAGHAVSVVNPAQISVFGSAVLNRTKTDKKDARLIARFCAERRPQLWEPPPPELKELRSLVTRRDALERMRTQEMNRLRDARSSIRVGIERHLAYLEQEISSIDAEIQRKTDSDLTLKKQHSIPGLGCADLVHVAIGILNSGKMFVHAA